MNAEYLLSESEKPNWFSYPDALIDLLKRENLNLTPWEFINAKRVSKAMQELFLRYGRTVIPFAHRKNNDDIAVFEKGSGKKVLVIHNFAEKGNEIEDEFASFGDWLRAAEEESRDWLLDQ